MAHHLFRRPGRRTRRLSQRGPEGIRASLPSVASDRGPECQAGVGIEDERNDDVVLILDADGVSDIPGDDQSS